MMCCAGSDGDAITNRCMCSGIVSIVLMVIPRFEAASAGNSFSICSAS